MLYGIVKPLHELLALTLVYDLVQVVVDIGDVLFVPWIQLTSDDVPILVKFLATRVVVENRMAQDTTRCMSQCPIDVSTSNRLQEVLDFLQ